MIDVISGEGFHIFCCDKSDSRIDFQHYAAVKAGGEMYLHTRTNTSGLRYHAGVLSGSYIDNV